MKKDKEKNRQAHQNFSLTNSGGQVMILTVLALGGTILGATAIAGTLMLYQLRQAKDTQSSTEAIYNADAGIECGLYQFFTALKNTTDTRNINIYPCNTGNAMSVNFECVDSDGATQNGSSGASCSNVPINNNTTTPDAIISIGSSANGTVRRAFYVSVAATSSVLKIPQ
ncbi:hypothetical protein M1513_01280 [Patescibacteria group bacterium]|nr:hypothetical protein [Patescibacteria group bacterium]